MSDSGDQQRLAQEQLYEDERLRSNLTDNQATPLLDWAAQQLQASEPAALENTQRNVSAALRLINSAAAQDHQAAQATLSKLPDLLRDLPASAPPPLPNPNQALAEATTARLEATASEPMPTAPNQTELDPASQATQQTGKAQQAPEPASDTTPQEANAPTTPKTTTGQSKAGAQRDWRKRRGWRLAGAWLRKLRKGTKF